MVYPDHPLLALPVVIVGTLYNVQLPADRRRGKRGLVGGLRVLILVGGVRIHTPSLRPGGKAPVLLRPTFGPIEPLLRTRWCPESQSSNCFILYASENRKNKLVMNKILFNIALSNCVGR